MTDTDPTPPAADALRKALALAAITLREVAREPNGAVGWRQADEGRRGVFLDAADVIEANLATLEVAPALLAALRPFAAAWQRQLPGWTDAFDILTPRDFKRAVELVATPDAGVAGE